MTAFKASLAGGAGALALCVAGAGFAGDKNSVTKTYALSGFERIDIAGVYDLDVRVGPDFSITLTGHQKEMERVEASVREGVLYLTRADGKRRWGVGDDQEIEAEITLPSLNSLDVSGVVAGSIEGVDAEQFNIDLSGVGNISLEGECGVLYADVSGVGDLEAEELECASVFVEVSGVGSASVYARDKVSADVSGMGDIDVYGSPDDVSADSGMFADITVH